MADFDFRATNRGFLLCEFTDRYGAKCSLQESSLATEDCIWLGVDNDHNGHEVAYGRMHLTKEMARQLLPLLRYFIREGRLGTDDPDTQFNVGTWVLGVAPFNRNVEGRIVSVTKGVSLVVQDNNKPGPSGLIETKWDQAALVWELLEVPEEIPSVYDRLRDAPSEDDDSQL